MLSSILAQTAVLEYKWKYFPCNRSSLWHITLLIRKSRNVARRLYVQTNGRLIGSELFSISTRGDAVKKHYISVEGLFSSWDLCKHKNGLHSEVQVNPFMYNISSPSPLAVVIRGHGDRSASVFHPLSSLFQTTAQALLYLHFMNGSFPFQRRKLISTARPSATDLPQHKGICIYFPFFLPGKIHRDV